MRIVAGVFATLLLCALISWLIWGVYDRCYLDVPQNCLVFKMGSVDGYLIQMTPGGHWVNSKIDYQIEPLLSEGKKNFTAADVEKLREVAEKDGWVNFCNWRYALSRD